MEAEVESDPSRRYPKSVVVVFSEVKREYFATQEAFLTEKNAEHYAWQVAEYFKRIGILASCLPADTNLSQNLKKLAPEMVINLADTVRGDETLSASIPGMLEMLQIPPIPGQEYLDKLSIPTSLWFIN